MIKLISIALLAALSAIAQPSASKKMVVPAGSRVGPNFSPGIQAGDTLYVSGQTGTDPQTQKVPDKFEDEVQLCLDHIAAILKAGGMDFSNAVSVTVYLTDISLFQRMNAVYVKAFPEPRPARTTVGISALAAAGAHIEISVTAHK